VSEVERLRNIEIADVRRIMNKREGRRFMWRLLTMTRPLTTCGPCGVEEANWTNGLRSVGTTLWGEITAACPEQFTLMQTEAAQDALESEQRLRAEAEANDRRSNNDGY
jgi:hypothetical protein